MTASLSRRIVRSRGAPVGAHCRFDSGAVNELRELIRAVAACLPRHEGAPRSLVRRNAGAIKLLEQMR